MNIIKLTYFSYDLQFRNPFSIAAGTRNHTPAVFVELKFGDFTGYGEAALPPYLPDTQQSVISFLKKLQFGNFSHVEIDSIMDYVDGIEEGNFPAKAAVDMALHDLVGKINGTPVHRMQGFKTGETPLNCYTIGMDDPGMLEKKIIEAKDFHLLKVKLGGDRDKEIIKVIRSISGKEICVDANQGWKNVDHALEMIYFLKEQDTIFVEQPLPKNLKEEAALLKEKSPLPLIADESFQTENDFSNITDGFHGINIKLMKCGGIRAGRRILEKAKEKNLQVLIGCMSESSCGTAAAMQLAPMATWTDLDGPLLISNDPFSGVGYESGKIMLNETPGTGAKKILS